MKKTFIEEMKKYSYNHSDKMNYTKVSLIQHLQHLIEQKQKKIQTL